MCVVLCAFQFERKSGVWVPDYNYIISGSRKFISNVQHKRLVYMLAEERAERRKAVYGNKD